MDRILKLNYLPFLPQAKDSFILDFGCGKGRMLTFLNEAGYKNILGIDSDPRAIEDAQLKNKTLLVNNLESFIKEYALKFDCIILKDVIYYFERERVVEKIQDILKCLKPQGIVIIEVFNGALLTSSYTAAKDLNIKTIYTESSLLQILKHSNLYDIKISEQRFETLGLKASVYKFMRLFYKLFLKLIFIFERGFDEHNPKLLTKSIIAFARKP